MTSAASTTGCGSDAEVVISGPGFLSRFEGTVNGIPFSATNPNITDGGTWSVVVSQPGAGPVHVEWIDVNAIGDTDSTCTPGDWRSVSTIPTRWP